MGSSDKNENDVRRCAPVFQLDVDMFRVERTTAPLGHDGPKSADV